MNKQLIEQGGRWVHRALLILKKYSPEILVGTGIVGGVTAAVMVGKASMELEETLMPAKTQIHNLKVKKHSKRFDEIPEAEFRKELARAYFKGGKAVAHLYWRPALVGAMSVGCILTAHGVMRGRNAALVAAYNALDSAYNAYRERVREELGEDRDRDYALGVVQEDILVSDDDGKVEKAKIKTLDGGNFSPYARFFDELNLNWEPNPESNMFFLTAQQTYANEMLRTRGHIFLNEVYDALGLERTKAGAVVGWLYEKNTGDDHVDFGIFNFDNPRARDFVNGDEASILLDFNVDGVIYDKI